MRKLFKKIIAWIIGLFTIATVSAVTIPIFLDDDIPAEPLIEEVIETRFNWPDSFELENTDKRTHIVKDFKHPTELDKRILIQSDEPIIDDEMVFETIAEPPSEPVKLKKYCFKNREVLKTVVDSIDGCVDELEYKKVKDGMVSVIKNRKESPPSFQEVMLWEEMIIEELIGTRWDVRECRGMKTIDVLNTLLEKGECKK